MRMYYGFEDSKYGYNVCNADGYRIGTVYVFDSREKRGDWVRSGNRRDVISSKEAHDWILHYVEPWSRNFVLDKHITSHSSLQELIDAYVEYADENGAHDVWNGV